jgi:hypothetical protein
MLSESKVNLLLDQFLFAGRGKVRYDICGISLPIYIHLFTFYNIYIHISTIECYNMW